MFVVKINFSSFHNDEDDEDDADEDDDDEEDEDEGTMINDADDDNSVVSFDEYLTNRGYLLNGTARVRLSMQEGIDRC